MNTTDNAKHLELENILSFLGIIFIDYKGHRTSNGHKTAKNAGEIKEFFGKEVMTSGQFIEDIKWWDFKNNWNDLMFLVEKIENYNEFANVLFAPNGCAIDVYIEKGFSFSNDCDTKIQAVYKACLEFAKWYNQQNQ